MRLGIFGGTFDPIHYGHLRMAEEARGQIGLDRVLFVPNRVSPFKAAQKVTSAGLRAEMVRQAVASNPAFRVSTIELDRPGPSYSIDTVRALMDEWPDAEMYFLTGTDAVRDLTAWHEAEALIGLTRFVALTRPGVTREDVLDALPAGWADRVLFMAMPELDISATNLRGAVREGRSIRYLTPPCVETMIYENRLYRDDAEQQDSQFRGETK